MNPNLLTPQNLQFILPGAVGVGVGLLILFFLSRGRRPMPVPSAKSSSSVRSSQWVAQTQSLSERRTSVRREGAPVKIVLSSPAFKTGTNNGYVLDRSTGGLRIALEAGMAPGSTVQIRAHHAPENTPWVTVIVRSCKNTGEHYELGCEFDKTPPWNVLLLFG
jgi:hypothetical protein